MYLHLLLSLLLIHPVFAFAEKQADAFLESGMVSGSYYDQPFAEVERLRKITPSPFSMDAAQLQRWDEVIAHLSQTEPLGEGDLHRLYAYLYTAQRDAGFLSYEATGRFAGSLDLISLNILHLFYPYYRPTFKLKQDTYSSELTQIVFPYFQKRFAEETKGISRRILLSDNYYWTGQRMEFGENVNHWTPWAISPLLHQIDPDASTKLEDLVEKKFPSIQELVDLDRVLYRHEEPRATPNTQWERGVWIDEMNQYLFSHDVAIDKVLLVRSVMAIALYDTIISTQQNKQQRRQKRNRDRLSSRRYDTMRTAMAATATTVLTYYFPDEKERWQSAAKRIVDENS